MPVRNFTIGGDNAVPFTWEVPQVAPLLVQAISAYFDGGFAAGDFRPCLDVYNETGFLVARVLTTETVSAGDAAEVSFAPFLDAAAGSAAEAGSTPYATTPQVIPIFVAQSGPYYGSGFAGVRVDNTVRANAVRTNSYAGHVAATDDDFTHLVTLGPKGSIWAFSAAYKQQPDGGKFKLALGSVPSPDPNRPGDAEGSLSDDTPTWVEFSDEEDTYAAVAGDGFVNGTMSQVRILGDDGDPLTTITAGGDAYTGFDSMDGGAGVYSLRVRCSGKRAASTGFKVELTWLACLRLDDAGMT